MKMQRMTWNSRIPKKTNSNRKTSFRDMKVTRRPSVKVDKTAGKIAQATKKQTLKTSKRARNREQKFGTT